MARYYPAYLDLRGKTCLVVGGGAVAERKITGLLDAGAAVRVVSPALSSTLQSRALAGEFEYICASYASDHLSGVWLAFAATDNREVNAHIAADARSLGIAVNSADAPEEGDFIVPSVVRRGDLCVGISTGGNQPMLAARLADELEARFGPEYGAFVELLGAMRAYIKTKTSEPAMRRGALNALLDAEAEIRTLLRSFSPEDARTAAEQIVETALRVSGPDSSRET